jgi:sugar transferase (PEP-CTERM/EpsH1 system associated)
MRILFLTHRLPYAPNRGDRLRAFYMLEAMSTFAKVDLVSFVQTAEEARHAKELRDKTDRIVTIKTPRARNMFRGLGTLITSRPLTHTLLAAPEMQERITDVVSGAQPDVVLAYCSGMARFAMTEPLAEYPFVLDLVDVDSEKWRALAQIASPPKRLIYQREAECLEEFEARAANQSEATIVVNERERDALAALAPSANIHVVPNGVDLDRLTVPSLRKDRPRVVFCGVMNYGPNEQGAIWMAREVWPYVRQARPDAELYLVGADPTPAVRALQSQDLGVTVTGTVPDVRPYLWDSTVAVAPLLTARGVQNKALEAIATGLPCVVTPVVASGLPAEAMPACRVAGTPQAFAATVVDLLNRTAAERKTIVQAAKLEPLSWKTRLHSLQRILELAASSRTQKVA